MNTKITFFASVAVGFTFLFQATSKETETNKQQEVSKVFKSNGLKVTIEANKKIVNFLNLQHHKRELQAIHEA